MRPLRTRLLEARQQLGLQSYVIERDYLLSWVLAGISEVPDLGGTLVFKGGTALKKCYFGGYRFSEDLDFSALEGVPQGDAMERLVGQACDAAKRLLDEYAPVDFSCERYTERDPHPGGQEAFTIRARLPGHARMDTAVKVEITVDEPILWPVEHRTVIHEYGEPLAARLQVYSLEEVVAEKLRAILQQLNRLESGRWIRTRARDYYDLWRVLGAYQANMDPNYFNSRLHVKCAMRGVHFEGQEDFFHDRMLADVGRGWEHSLGPLVPQLPSFETVINELRPRVAALLSSDW